VDRLLADSLGASFKVWRRHNGGRDFTNDDAKDCRERTLKGEQLPGDEHVAVERERLEGTLGFSWQSIFQSDEDRGVLPFRSVKVLCNKDGEPIPVVHPERLERERTEQAQANRAIAGIAELVKGGGRKG